MEEPILDESAITILDRIAAGAHTDADLATLRRALLVGAQGNVIQIGEYNVQIGVGKDIRIGDAIYQGPDAAAIQAALRAVLDEIGWQRRFGVPFQAPPLPAHFVPRSEVTDALKTRLLTDVSDRPGVLVVSAIHGLGGIGKSTLAAALCYSPDVQARFPDGILWTTLGQQPEQLPLLTAWIQSLGDYQFRPTTVEAASAHVRTLLHDKAVLLVVDDVWDADHVRSFLVGGQRCRVLITTRRADVADEVGADLRELNVMTSEQALALLVARLGRALEDAERPDALRLAKDVGYLPLALELAAVRVRAGVAWADLCMALEAEVARLEALEGPRGRRRGQTRLEASLNLSLDSLRRDDEAGWHAFAWLGVLPDDVIITATMAATLWGMNQAEAAGLLEFLWNDALLLSGVPVLVGERTWQSYRVHDLLHDVARRFLTMTKPIGLGLTLSQANAALLERYRSRVRNRLWHALADDGYVHAHLTWHMEQAGCAEMYSSLLGEETPEGRNGWFAVRQALGQVTGYMEDVQRTWRWAENSTPPDLVLQTRCALLQGTISSLARLVSATALVQSLANGLCSACQAMDLAALLPDSHERIKALVGLAPLLPDGSKERLLSIATQMSDERSRALSLTGIVQYLPGLLKEELLSGVSSFTTPWLQCEVVINIWPHLPEEMRFAAFHMLQSVQDEDMRVRAYIRLGDSLSPELLHRAILDASQARNSRTHVSGVVHLARRLGIEDRNELLNQVLAETRAISNTSERIQAFAYLLEPFYDKLEPEERNAALKLAREYGAKRRRRGDLGRPYYLDEELRDLIVTQQSRVDAVYQTPDLLQHVDDSIVRVETLMDLVRYVPSGVRSEAIRQIYAAVEAMPQSTLHTRLLSQLSAHLGQDEGMREVVVQKALEAIASLSGQDLICFEALMEVVPSLSSEQLVVALEIVERWSTGSLRAAALRRMARFLSGKLLTKALYLAWRAGDLRERVQSLTELAANLPDYKKSLLLEQVLSLARKINGSWVRASALCYLEARFPGWLEPDEISHVSKIAQTVLVEGTTKTVQAYYESGHEEMLVEFLKYLPISSGPAVFQELLTSLKLIADESTRGDLLTKIVSEMPDEFKPQLLTQTLEAVPRGESYYVQILQSLLPYVAQSEIQSLLQEAIGNIMVAFRKKRGEAQRWVESEVWESGYESTTAQQAWKDVGAQVGLPSLDGLAIWIEVIPRERLMKVWNEILHELASGHRASLLLGLRSSKELLNQLDGSQAVVGVFRALQEIGRWWP